MLVLALVTVGNWSKGFVAHGDLAVVTVMMWIVVLRTQDVLERRL